MAYGPWLAIVLPICARVLFAICGATLSLATAGYAFKEIFVHSFPNLGFSFYLLGAILVVNLIGPKAASVLQQLCFSVVIGGLLALILLALSSSGTSPMPTADAVAPLPWEHLSGWLVAIWLLVGFDLAFWAGRDTHAEMSSDAVRSVGIAIGVALGALILCLWGLTSLAHVPADRLADTAVPHLMAARLIYGQTGRIIMGVVVIAGSTGAVNALLLCISRMMTRMAEQRQLPSFFAWRPQRAWIPLILLAVGPAALMLEGYAGKPITPVWARSALLFWLMLHAAIHMAVVILNRQSPNRTGRPVWQPVAGVILIGLYVIGLIAVEPSRGQLLLSMLVIALGVSLWSGLWLRIRRSPQDVTTATVAASPLEKHV